MSRAWINMDDGTDDIYRSWDKFGVIFGGVGMIELKM